MATRIKGNNFKTLFRPSKSYVRSFSRDEECKQVNTRGGRNQFSDDTGFTFYHSTITAPGVTQSQIRTRKQDRKLAGIR